MTAEEIKSVIVGQHVFSTAQFKECFLRGDVEIYHRYVKEIVVLQRVPGYVTAQSVDKYPGTKDRFTVSREDTHTTRDAANAHVEQLLDEIRDGMQRQYEKFIADLDAVAARVRDGLYDSARERIAAKNTQ